MVSTLMELRQCKMVLADVKEELEEESIAFNRKNVDNLIKKFNDD